MVEGIIAHYVDKDMIVNILLVELQGGAGDSPLLGTLYNASMNDQSGVLDVDSVDSVVLFTGSTN